MLSVLRRLQRVKTTLVALLLVLTGAGLLWANNYLADTSSSTTITSLPIGEIGGVLFGAGFLGIWLESILRREQDEINEIRLRAVMTDHAPVMRDAVLQAFAAGDEDLQRVAKPETLDKIIENALALRIGNKHAASELFDDLRAQAIEGREYWHDATVSVEISDPPDPADANQFFEVVVRWDYKTVPYHLQRHFVVTSDRKHYSELTRPGGNVSAWYLDPQSGVDARSTRAFEVTQFTVGDRALPIKRATTDAYQIYTVNLPERNPDDGFTSISYTYRTVAFKQGRWIYLDIEQPTRDVRFEFRANSDAISSLSVVDLLPATRPTRVIESPVDGGKPSIRIETDGWVFPRAGVVCIIKLK